MAEDVNATHVPHGVGVETKIKIRKDVVEIPFWLFPDKPKWVSGVQPHTTCQDILMSLVRSDPTKSFSEHEVRDRHLVLLEQWRGVEKPLAHGAKILKIWNAWGKERHEVRFVVKRLSSARLSRLESMSSRKNTEIQSQKDLLSSSFVQDKDVVEKASKTYRKLRRRRNSLSSVGSLCDELHPKRLDQFYQKTPIHPDKMTQKAFEIVRKTDALLEKHGNGNHFDDHIEEMMKIIVSQGRQICKELKRVQQNGDTLERRETKKSRDKSCEKSKIEENPTHSRNQMECLTADAKIQSDKQKGSSVSLGGDLLHSNKENYIPLVPMPRGDDKFCNENQSKSRDAHSKKQQDDETSKRSRTLPKIPTNAIKFDLTQSIADIPKRAKTSEESFLNSSVREETETRPLVKRASSSWDLSQLQTPQKSPSSLLKPTLIRHASDLKHIQKSEESPYENHSEIQHKCKGFLRRSSSFLNKSLFKSSNKSDLENQKLETEPNQSLPNSEMTFPTPPGFSDNTSSTLTTCHSDFHPQPHFGNSDAIQFEKYEESKKNSSFQNGNNSTDCSLSKRDTSLSDYYSMETSRLGSISNPESLQDSLQSSDKIKETISQMQTFSLELTRLAQLNERLQFSEESADLLQTEIRQRQDVVQRSGQPPNFLQTSEAAQEHLTCARTEVHRLRILNENVAREISENQKQLHGLDAAVKSKRAILKHLEYDVNVIEKEGRKLAKELDKVLNIRIDNIFPNDKEHENTQEEDANELEEIESELRTGQQIVLSSSGSSFFESSSRISTTGSPESSSSGNSSRTTSETMASTSGLSRSVDKSPTKPSSDCLGDNDNNSDTGLSSLHSSSDEGSYEVGTLV